MKVLIANSVVNLRLSAIKTIYPVFKLSDFLHVCRGSDANWWSNPNRWNNSEPKTSQQTGKDSKTKESRTGVRKLVFEGTVVPANLDLNSNTDQKRREFFSYPDTLHNYVLSVPFFIFLTHSPTYFLFQCFNSCVSRSSFSHRQWDTRPSRSSNKGTQVS